MSAEEVLHAHGGVVATSQFTSLRSAWSRLRASGAVFSPLPGVAMATPLAGDPDSWIRAVQLWEPNAVFAGAAAARLTFDPAVDLTRIVVHTKSRITPRGPLEFRRHVIPPHLADYAGDFRVTCPDVTALSSGMDGNFEPGTSALRQGLITPASLRATAAAWPVRPRSEMPRVLRVLGSNPWSVAEVEAHTLLRQTGIIGWVGNPRLVIGGVHVSPDVAFLRSRIAFEINSFAHHSSRSDMERDARRTNLFASAGWRTFSLTPRQIRDHPVETAQFLHSVIPRRYRRGAGGPGR